MFRFCPRFLVAIAVLAAAAASAQQPGANIYHRKNLTAWCVVPFDAKKRGPEARAEMLARLGIFRLAYDWREEHVATFDEEIETLTRWGIALQAFWFPGELNKDARTILDALERHGVKTELWVSMHGGEIACTPEEHEQRVAAHVAALRPIVDEAARIGCKVGLYNHGGWFGEPENQIEILRRLDAPNAGLVYNLHHGHGHIGRFKELIDAIKPFALSINLNGMTEGGEQSGDKILPLGNGERDLELLRIIRDSGYAGPIGVLGHTMDDAEETLADNLDGLDWLVRQLDGKEAGPRPPLRVKRTDAAAVGAPGMAEAFGLALRGSLVAEGNPAYRMPPITVELLARLRSQTGFNILAANDPKASGAHWELFTEAGSGQLSLYIPGYAPDHVRTGTAICDDAWRRLALHLEAGRARLYVDGACVADQPVARTAMAESPGGFAIGRLVEGGIDCDGDIDDLRISRGIVPLALHDAPLPRDDTTLGLWNFDDLPRDAAHAQPEEIENPARRAALPEFQIIPAASPEGLSPAAALPADYFATWQRSHGNSHNSRYSASRRISRANVALLKVAWEYRSGDGPGNVQCNPIVVNGVIYAPTSGQNVVAVDAATGKERWRFELGEGRPAFRGLVYWPGDGETGARLFFNAGPNLWALDPSTGRPIETFGEGGKVVTGDVYVAGAVHKNVLVLPTYQRDVSGFDVHTGERLWTFHTMPGPGELGGDTWDGRDEGANCWGGMALDEQRGIAYISTGSPKPNFSGNTHRGQNLFANCVIALDALTGKRLWHFQELRHDIWDLDMPAPPVLATIDFRGRKVDVVAQVTKIGNTFVLDRVTGESLFPVRLRRAPVSKLPGERTWPYQPDIELPTPFARQKFGLDDVTDRSPEAREHVLATLANANYGWFEPFEENKPTALYGFHGGAEWTGAALDPATGKLYVSANHIPWIVTVFEPDRVSRDPNLPPTRGEEVYREHCAKCHGADRFGVGVNPPLQGLARRLDDVAVTSLLRTGRNLMPALADAVSDADRDALLGFLFLRDVPAREEVHTLPAGPTRYTHNGYPKLVDHEGYPGCKPPWGTLNCIDLASGKLDWQVPLGIYPDLAAWGEDKTGAENFGGPSVTAGGLVFCAGTQDETIRAFDAATGAVLWEHRLPYGGYAPPSIYEAGGREFVVIAATGGGKLGGPMGDAYMAFSLP